MTTTISGYELTPLEDGAFEGKNGHGFDFTVTPQEAGLWAVDIFRANVEDPDAAYMVTLEANSVEEAVKEAMLFME
jgi:hypothetical protein